MKKQIIIIVMSAVLVVSAASNYFLRRSVDRYQLLSSKQYELISLMEENNSIQNQIIDLQDRLLHR